MMTTRPFRMTPQSIWLPGPPAARNHVLSRWMRQKISGQIGSKYQGRPGRGERRLKGGIAGQYMPGAMGGG